MAECACGCECGWVLVCLWYRCGDVREVGRRSTKTRIPENTAQSPLDPGKFCTTGRDSMSQGVRLKRA